MVEDNEAIKRVHGWLDSAIVVLPIKPQITIQKLDVAYTKIELACQSKTLYIGTASDQGLKAV